MVILMYGYVFDSTEDKLEFNSGSVIEIVYDACAHKSKVFYPEDDMFVATYIKIRLIDNKGNIIEEHIEKNPYSTDMDIGGFEELAEAQIRDGVL